MAASYDVSHEEQFSTDAKTNGAAFLQRIEEQYVEEFAEGRGRSINDSMTATSRSFPQIAPVAATQSADERPCSRRGLKK
ncbi:unnamed protein product [Gongylonema pulchrum]|uniref:Lsm_interact domain-containing protein n=1 Tax=Gongylonema pulchrum TaxID=637853 RepID=A0A183F1C8_9BILA|nr:unnamed protein product [Gongylonema pulchrum]